MNPKNKIESLIMHAEVGAGDDMTRVRIRMVCEKFSDECIDYPFEYISDIKSILIKDKSGISYRYSIGDFMKKIDNGIADIVALPKKNPEFNFKKYFIDNGLTVYDIKIAIAGTWYNVKPESPTLFDPACRPGCRCSVILTDVCNPENVKIKNFKEIEEMVKLGEVIVKNKKE